jgi:hypothetical protein
MKAETKISGMYVALFLGAVAFVGITILQVDLFTTYHVSVPGELSYLNNSVSQISKATNYTELITPKSYTGIAPLDSLIAGLFSSLSTLTAIGYLYTTLITNIPLALHIPIPGEMFILITGAIMAFIVLKIIGIISNRDV